MIKQPWLFGISMVLLLVAGGFATERLWFLSHAEKVQGTVVEITAQDGRCGGGGKRRRSYTCTRYTAHIQFATRNGGSGGLSVGAGRSRGKGQPTSWASYRVSQTLPVVYDPRNEAKAYLDSIMGVWGTPIFILIAQFSTLIASVSESRRRRLE